MEKEEESSELRVAAWNNLMKLKRNLYPGRGIIMGMDESGKYLIQVYWIMGRSENSRNRIFVIEEKGILKTEAADPAKVKDPALIIYIAMAEESPGRYAVSNGHQTLDASQSESLDGLKSKMTENVWRYEPDAPNFTPRITAVFRPHFIGHQIAEISILKKSPFGPERVQNLYKIPIIEPGFGYCIHTYDGDGDPLPSFSGDPYLLPLEGDIKNIAEKIWSNLDEENRVSLAVKFIEIRAPKSEIFVINKYTAV